MAFALSMAGAALAAKLNRLLPLLLPAVAFSIELLEHRFGFIQRENERNRANFVGPYDT